MREQAMYRSWLLRSAVLAVLVTVDASGVAIAASDGVEEQLKALRQMIERQQAQLDSQQRTLEAQRAEIDALRSQAGSSPAARTPAVATVATNEARVEALEKQATQSRLASQEAPDVRLNNGQVSIATPDGRSSITVRGNVQLDLGHYGQDPAGPPETDYRRGSVGSTRENDAARDLSDGAYFRRARLGVEGVLARDFTYRFVTEFAGSGTEGPARINDAYLAYTGLAPFTFQLGAFSPPANLADGVSVEGLMFIERATPAELSRTLGGADGRLGFGVRTGGPRWLGALTYTGRTVGDAETFDSQSAFVGRLGGLVVTNDDTNVHLGLNGTYVIEPAQTSLAGSSGFGLRLRDRPELRVDSTRLIDTGSIESDGGYSAGVEFAANWQNFFVQAENFWYGFERRSSTLADPSFGGYYVEASWFPTGERRRYAPGNAAFQAPRPRIPFDGQGGWGAWELALRYSNTDLNDREGAPGTAASPDSVRGGEQSIYGAGVNWYLNSNVKLMLNYLHVDVDRLNPAGPGNPTPFGAPPATPPVGVQVGQDFDIFALRSQFSF
jgi:phosphate-selective porin OprO/OprP